MKKLRFIAVFVFVFLSLSILSALEPAVRGQVEFNIRFYDRRVYYVTTDPIYIQVTITNNSPAPFRFKLADERAFSIDFDIRTMTNRQVPEAAALIRKRTQYQQIFFREITIESGESFSFVEDIRDFVNFTQAGSYRVQAKVYPELFRANGIQLVESNYNNYPELLKASGVQILESNYLNLSLRADPIQGSDGLPVDMDAATGAVLARQNLSPDDVVTYTLTARQQSNWERFFLYLDLESMLSRDSDQRSKWQAENEEGRRLMINDYRRRLQNSTVDIDINVVPTSFEILRTVYNNNSGEVTALLRFRNQNYTELRRYTYFLEKKDNFWVIVNYSVQLQGTVANN